MSVPSTRRVHHRVLLQRVHRGLHEEGHEAQLHAVLLLELLLVAVAQLDHRRHVDFVERGEDGGGGLRLHQALGDALAQARHGHALLGAVARREVGRAGSRASRPRGRAVLAASTSPFVTRPSRPVPGTEAVSTPFSAAIFVADGEAAVGGLRPPGAAGGWVPAFAGATACLSAAGAAALAVAFASVSIVAITSPLVTAVAVVLHDLREHAVGGRRQLEHDLVGLDVDQVLVALDRLADLLAPGDQRGLGDRFGELRDLDFDLRHDRSLLRIC